MGSTSFFDVGAGPTIEQAYIRASERATFEHGASGYTGTIAEKSGYQVITTEPMTLKAAYRYAEQLLDDEDERVRDKWGPASAIPIIGMAGQRSATFTTRVSNGDGITDALVKAAADQRADQLRKPGETLVKTLLTVTPIGNPRVTVVKASQRPKIRYAIQGGYKPKEGPYETEAAAIKAIKADPVSYMEGYNGGEVHRVLRVVPVPFPNSAGEVTLTYRTVSVEVEASYESPGDGPVESWLFFGWASC